MGKFDDIDKLIKPAASWVKAREALSRGKFKRIYPAKHQKFTSGKYVAPNPEDSKIHLMMEKCKDGDYKEARAVAESFSDKGNERWGHAMIEHYEKNAPFEDAPLFIRQIAHGKAGKQEPVGVVLGYKTDGISDIAVVNKNLLYVVDGRKLRGRIEGMVPQPPSQAQIAPAAGSPAEEPAESPGVGESGPPEEDVAPDEESNKEVIGPSGPGNELIGDDGVNSDREPVEVPEGGGEPEGSSKPSSGGDRLRRLLGNKLVSALEKLGVRDRISMSDIDVNGLAVYNGRNGGPIRADLLKGDIVEDAVQFRGLIADSSFARMDAPDDLRPFRPDDMGEVLLRIFQPKLVFAEQRRGREAALGGLRTIRKHMESLSRVFGFDDPQQLEAFFAAWLMKDSTCRLTGIPGTGKTTVINSAATLLCNSYGYNNGLRYYAAVPVREGEEHQPIIFPDGQSYNVNYGAKEYEETRRRWDGWRFNEWDIDSETSGAYIYDSRFLQMTSDSGFQKLPMTPEAFSRILFDCDVREEQSTEGLLKQTLIRSTPITKAQLVNWFGSEDNLPITDEIKYEGDNVTYRSEKAAIHLPLYTDAGGNEGFILREFLSNHFYDSRLDEGEAGLYLIANEMLMESGIAKIDYDKRAEEILYGIEIRQVTTEDRITGDTVASYEFEPTPRPIVTQPIKFFNEANRSGSGVEDAILGLIAEKTVEYRGRTFTSPAFVAWMDTNPHQKGNDLAFVDRIDMELYFGTLSLGSRFAALSERFGGNSKGTDPQLQLIARMLKASNSRDYIQPMRFKDLTYMWKIINGIPFNSAGTSEEEGGALLDISLLSVLFTQRFMVKEKTDRVYGMEHTYSYDNEVYSSPLVDISTTTNLQYESQHKEEIEKFGTGQDGTKSQAPVLIKRILGFRFSNSLIKMTRALAFLRGKDFVTRQEVVDAMPYTIAHRLGPAREGEDPKGRDIGIEREGMRLTNEQQFINQLIVHGYLLRDTNSLLGAVTPETPSMFNIWDAFLNTCYENIQSNDAYWKYEDEIILPLKARVRQGGDITPVHWHIGTMVVENEKRGKGKQRDGLSYKQRFNRYLEAISRPSALEARESVDSGRKLASMVANHAAGEYYGIRGAIARDPWLFSDDRENLLELCESKIASITGHEMRRASDVIISSSAATAKEYSTQPRSGPAPTEFKWRSYGDALGVWGRLITNGGNANLGIAELGAGGNLLDIAGVNMESNQDFALYGNFEVTGPGGGKGDLQDTPFFSGLSKIITTLQPYVFGNGVELADLPAPAPEGSLFGPVDTQTLESFEMNAKDMVFRWLGGESGINLSDGYMACFQLKHAFDGNPGLFTNIDGEDDLRLWLRLRVIRGNQNAGQTATFGIFVGITSATMKPLRFDSEGNPLEWTVLDFNDPETYNPGRFAIPAEWIKEKYEDTGNLTRDDLRFFSQRMKAALDESQV